jgi:hypothetical protein
VGGVLRGILDLSTHGHEEQGEEVADLKRYGCLRTEETVTSR